VADTALDDFPQIVRLDSLEWGHRWLYDGSTAPDESQGEARGRAAAHDGADDRRVGGGA
jgi:hypothetical protein